MKLTRKETITLEMDIKDFSSLMYYISSCEEQTILGDIDASKAGKMYNTIQELNQ